MAVNGRLLLFQTIGGRPEISNPPKIQRNAGKPSPFTSCMHDVFCTCTPSKDQEDLHRLFDPAESSRRPQTIRCTWGSPSAAWLNGWSVGPLFVDSNIKRTSGKRAGPCRSLVWAEHDSNASGRNNSIRVRHRETTPQHKGALSLPTPPRRPTWQFSYSSIARRTVVQVDAEHLAGQPVERGRSARMWIVRWRCVSDSPVPSGLAGESDSIS